MVYVTSAYPFYFAMHTSADLDDQAEPLVIEIDSTRLNRHLLYPDEDFVAQFVAEQTGKPIEEIHGDITADLVDISTSCQDTSGKPAQTWEASLAALATCCYRGVIPRRAMTRYCVFNWRLRPLLAAMTFNEGPYLGGPHEQYRQLTQWMFGGRRKLPTFIPDLGDGFQHVLSGLRRAHFKLEEDDRTGITIVNL
jgi:hypothetical protein